MGEDESSEKNNHTFIIEADLYIFRDVNYCSAAIDDYAMLLLFCKQLYIKEMAIILHQMHLAQPGLEPAASGLQTWHWPLNYPNPGPII